MNKIIIVLIVIAILVMVLLMYALGVFDGSGVLLRDVGDVETRKFIYSSVPMR